MRRQNFIKEATQTRHGECFNGNLVSDETKFIGGLSLFLGGASFQWDRYWGVFKRVLEGCIIIL